MIKPIRVVFYCLAVFIAACAATSGRRFDTTQIGAIEKGKTSRQEISSWFGEPYATVRMSKTAAGCVERWTYQYAEIYHGKTTAESLVVDFDGQGKVCDHAHAKQQ